MKKIVIVFSENFSQLVKQEEFYVYKYILFKNTEFNNAMLDSTLHTKHLFQKGEVLHLQVSKIRLAASEMECQK